MNVSNITLTPFITTYNSAQSHINKPIEKPQIQKLGVFPSYYCPNISFKGLDNIDFEYEFYQTSNDIILNHPDKIELTKELSDDQLEDFRQNLFPSDKPTLLNFFFDEKPSVLLVGDFPYFENNEKYDFVRRTLYTDIKGKKVGIPNTYILNKKLVKETIDQNKQLYTKRMGMDENSSTQQIYEKLTGEQSPLKCQEGYDDIIGVTLGFSPINSILFQVERQIPDNYELRNKRTYYATLLDEKFNAKDSVYKDFDESFKTEVQSSIDYIKTNYFKIPTLSPIGYGYINIVPDKISEQKHINGAKRALDKANKLLAQQQ